MDGSEVGEFEAFVMANGLALARFARLMARDREEAADLTQTTLERAYVRWRTVSRADDAVAYVRRMLINAAIDGSRRQLRQPATTVLFDVGAVERSLGAFDDRDALRGWLAALPARQRAVVVLRYYVGLTEAETALQLGLSVGSVKTHASRGLTRLRRHAEDGYA